MRIAPRKARGLLVPVAPDGVRRQTAQAMIEDVSSLLITTSLIFAESLPFKKLPKDLMNKILEEARWLRVVELLEPPLKASSCCNLYGTKLFQNFVLRNQAQENGLLLGTRGAHII